MISQPVLVGGCFPSRSQPRAVGLLSPGDMCRCGCESSTNRNPPTPSWNFRNLLSFSMLFLHALDVFTSKISSALTLRNCLVVRGFIWLQILRISEFGLGLRVPMDHSELSFPTDLPMTCLQDDKVMFIGCLRAKFSMVHGVCLDIVRLSILILARRASKSTFSSHVVASFPTSFQLTRPKRILP